MNHFILRRYSTFFKKSSPLKLGRWTIPNDQDTIDLKVDRANHDSCGGPLCTIVPLQAEKLQKTETPDNAESNEEEMLRFYTLSSFHVHVNKK